MIIYCAKCVVPKNVAFVAQLDRVPDSGSGGCGFESLRARKKHNKEENIEISTNNKYIKRLSRQMKNFEEQDGVNVDVSELRPVSFATRVNMYVQNNLKIVSGVLIGIVVLTLAIVFGSKYMRESAAKDSEKAGTALSRVLPLINQGDAESAKMALYGNKSIVIRNEPLLGLVDIVKKYESTPQGLLAAFYAGDQFLLMQDVKNAEKYFNIALDAESKLVLEGSYAGLGAACELKNDFKGAIENYKKAVENNTNYASKNRYQYYCGLCYEKLNQKDEAIKIYRGIIAENKTFEFIGKAKAGLVRLGTEIE